MKFTSNGHGALNTTSVIGGIVAIGLAYLTLRSLPELVRYLRISRM